MFAAKSPPHLVTLILLTGLSTLTLNMFLPSLASIAVDLQADYAVVSLALALYLAITAVLQLIIGPLSDRLGRRPVLLGAIAVFIFASVMCALAQDVWTFLAFRMLQGGMIAGYALAMAIVRDTNPPRQAAGLIGYIGMSMAVAPMLGPMLGGFLDTLFGWRANFWFYAVAGVTLLAVCWFDLGETHDREKSRGANTIQETKALLATPRYWAFALCSAFSVCAFYIFLAGAPLIAANVFSVSTATLGIYVGSITAGFIIGSFISGKLAPRYELTTMMIAGRSVACFGLLAGLALLLMGVLTPITYFGSIVFVGIGNGLTIPSSNAGAMSVRPDLAGTAAGVNGALTVACGALLTTGTGMLITVANGTYVLVGLMLTVVLAGLLSALWARQSG